MRAGLLRRAGASVAVALGLGAFSSPAAADPILSGDDAALETLRGGYERLEASFATKENGLFLDPIADPAQTATITQFFAQTAEDDFQTFSGLHPFEVLSEYDEHGDEGNFAGIASVGVAARLIVLKKSGAPAAEIDRARVAAVRAAQAWHVYGAIGGPGVVARGVRRVEPWNAGDPPFPGAPPTIVPLTDGNGAPLPVDKAAVWRAPVASGFDGWVWLDDTSKDQVSGYALASAWLWDALRDDPLVDPQVTDDLASDLGAFARALMQVAPEKGVDLCIRDADGRLTSFHDLNPRQLGPDGDPLPADSPFRNGFNSLLALGVFRAAYHVTGDPEIGAFYYEELVGRRTLPHDPTTTLGVIFLGAGTNYSNVNMAAIGLATLGRFETDAYVRGELATTLGTQFWNAGSDRDASHVEQAWFDAIYGAYATGATSSIRTRVAGNLSGFPAAPCFERDRVNCDDAEIAAQSCLAVDGTTTIELIGKGHGGGPVARDILPMSIRPDSDFHWRSDPHSVNGTASTRMDPRGDWLAAYWLARASELGAPDANLSPRARPPLPYTFGAGGGGGGAGGGGSDTTPPADDGCDCSTRPDRSVNAGAYLALAFGLALGSRRSGRSPRSTAR